MKKALLLALIIGFNITISYAQCVQFVNYPLDTLNWKKGSDLPGTYLAAFYDNDTFVITTSAGGENNYIHTIAPFTLHGASTVFTASFYFRMDSLSSCSDGLSFWWFTSSLDKLANMGLEGCSLGFQDTVAGFTVAMQTTVCEDNIYMKRLDTTIFNFCGLSYTTPSYPGDYNIATPLPSEMFLSDSQWHLCTVNYNAGNITTTFYTDTGTIVMTGYSLLSGTGYFGFMATNGAGHTRKSLRDIQICVSATSEITGDTLVCAGDTTLLSDTSAGGVWSSGSTGIATVNSTGLVTGVSMGTAVISYTIAGDTATITITVDTLPSAITGPGTVCTGAMITLGNSISGGTWSSSSTATATIGTSGSVSGLAAGTTTISYILDNACGIVSATSEVTVNTAPTVSAISGTADLCTGGATPLSDATASGVWSSSNTVIATVSSSGSVSGVVAGTATITYAVTNPCGTAYATIAITVNAMPTVGEISGTADLCTGGTTPLSDATVSGVWSSSNTAIATVNSSGTVSGVTAGTTIITYTVTNMCGTVHATMVVTVNTIPTVSSITGSPGVCIDNTTLLGDITASGVWSSSNTAIATINTSGNVSGLAAGTATITYNVTNMCGSAFATIAVTVNTTAVSAITGISGVCLGSTTTLSDATASGTWSSTNTAIATVSASGIVSGIATGTAMISYTVAGSAGCISSATVIVNVNSVLPSVTITGNLGVVLCGPISPETFTATPINGGTAPTYQWYVNGTTTGTGITYSYIPANGDTVACVMISNAVCAFPDSTVNSVGMTVLSPTPSVSISSPNGDSVCAGDNVAFAAVPVYGGTAPTYLWTVNGYYAGTGPNYVYTPSNGDTIMLTMTSNYPCATTTIVVSNIFIVYVFPPSANSLSVSVSQTTIAAGTTDVFTATATGAGASPSFQWYIDGSAVAGAESYQYITDSLKDGQVVSCKETSSYLCADPLTVTSSGISIIVTPSSIKQVNTNTSNFTLVPNPNNGTFSIKGSLIPQPDDQINIVVTDVLGQAVYKKTVHAINGNINEQIALANSVATGTYLVSITSGTDNVVFHVLIEE